MSIVTLMGSKGSTPPRYPTVSSSFLQNSHERQAWSYDRPLSARGGPWERFVGDVGSARLYRFAGSDIQFDDTQIDLMFVSKTNHGQYLRGMASRCLAHAHVNGVTGLRERKSGERPEATRNSVDGNNVSHK